MTTHVYTRFNFALSTILAITAAIELPAPAWAAPSARPAAPSGKAATNKSSTNKSSTNKSSTNKSSTNKSSTNKSSTNTSSTSKYSPSKTPTTLKPAAPRSTPAPATTEKREPSQPSFSPDGKSVVYVEQVYPNARSFEASSGNIWIMDTGTKSSGRLTSGHMDENPRFSPDGKRLVFTRDSDIWMINSDGSGLRNITRTPDTDEDHAEFSIDGHNILFIRGLDNSWEEKNYFGPVPVQRNLADGTEQVLLDDDYDVQQLIPHPTDDNRFYAVCKRLDAGGKPVPEVTLDKAVAEFRRDGTWLRTLYVPKPGAEKIDAGVRIGTVRATSAGVMMNIFKSLDATVHLITAQGMKTLPNIALAEDMIRDGRQIIATGSPRGVLVRCLEFYDVASAKSTYLRLATPTPATPAGKNSAPDVAPSTPAAAAPKTAAAFVARADNHYKAGRFDEALSDYNEALRLEPKNALALFGRAKVKELDADFDGALADYEAAVLHDATLVQAHINRGFLLNARERSGEAIDAYDTAIRLDPKNVEALHLRGAAYAARLESAAAIADFDAALKLNPDYVPALIARGDEFFATGDNPAALADYNRVLQLWPREIKAYRKRAEIHRKMGNTDAAAADERKAGELAKP